MTVAGDRSNDQSSGANSVLSTGAAAFRHVTGLGTRARLGLGACALAALAFAVHMGSAEHGGLPGLLEHWLASGDARAMPKQAVAGELPKAAQAKAATFKPTDAHWLTLGVEEVKPFRFRDMLGTDGKIAIDEDHTTPVFSPYSGRVEKLMVKPGDQVEVGAPLFTILATDMVQAQNEYMAANASVNKAKSALQLAEKIYNRNKSLVESKAAAVKDLQAAEDALTGSRNDMKTAEATLQASRNRLTILGKSNADIEALVTQGRITSETTVYAPIAGTIVQRKVGPGQFLSTGASDPVYVIGDLSKVWLIANVRETDAPKVRAGQTLEFTTLAIPDRVFEATISYVSTSVDPSTRRLLVRAEIPNPGMQLKPEMFANVSIITSAEDQAPSVPRTALIYEGSDVRVWVALSDKTIELRNIDVGLTNANRVQVLRGLSSGDKVITRGSLFIDRIAKLKD